MRRINKALCLFLLAHLTEAFYCCALGEFIILYSAQGRGATGTREQKSPRNFRAVLEPEL